MTLFRSKNTALLGTKTCSTIVYGLDGYLYELARLDPYPEHPNKPIKEKDYLAVMVVREELNKRALVSEISLY